MDIRFHYAGTDWLGKMIIKYHPAYSHNHAEKEAQLLAGRSKVLSRLPATSIHTENHNINVTKKECKQCNIHGIILLYFTSSRIRKMQQVAFLRTSKSETDFLKGAAERI